MKLAELRAARAKNVDDFQALVTKMNAEGYVDDEADDKSYKDLKKEIEGFDAKIERAEEAQRLAASLATPSQQPAGQGLAPDSKIIIPARARKRNLKHFRGDDAELRAYKFGLFMMAGIFGNEKAADRCRELGIPLTKAHSEGVATAGGFLVPDEMQTDIIDLRDEYGMFRRLCDVVPMGRDTMNTPRRTGGLTAYPVGEAQAPSDSTAGWDNVSLTARKWAVLTLISSELDEDAVVAIGDILIGEIAYAFAIAEDSAGFNGDGTGTYHGIKGFTKRFEDGIGTLKGSVNAGSNHNTFVEVDAADLALVMGTLPQYVYMRGVPSWYCSQMAWAQVFQRLIIASGGISKDDATGRVIYRYLGFPVEITPSMPAVTSTLQNKAMLMFGDIGLAAAFGDRRGMTIARSTEYKFAEDQIAIKGTERFDINIHSLGDANTAGPVVALIGNGT